MRPINVRVEVVYWFRHSLTVAGVDPGCSLLANVWTSSVSCEAPSPPPSHLVGVSAGVCLLGMEVLPSLTVKPEREQWKGFDSKTT